MASKASEAWGGLLAALRSCTIGLCIKFWRGLEAMCTIYSCIKFHACSQEHDAEPSGLTHPRASASSPERARRAC
jgi:hypothetical protein